ncbi:MAG: B12-binding domain-containing radical SAM protein [Endomicrobiia bacterium]
MKIILINPPIYDFSAYDVWLKPLGILYLSNILKNYNFEVFLLDCLDRNYFPQFSTKQDGTGKFPSKIIHKPEILKNIPINYRRYGVDENEIKNFLSNHKDTDYVIITSSMTYWYYGIREIIDLVKQILPKSKIFLGGNYPILLPLHAEKTFGHKVDLIFKKSFFYELLKYLNLKDIKKYNHFKNFPSPDYSHYKKVYYIVTRFSYGCFYNCDYCASKSLIPKYENKELNQFVEEIKFLSSSCECKNIVFYDDALFNHINIDLIKKLFKKILKLNLNLKFYTPNGINPKFIDKELAILMKELNFIDPRLSLETVSDLTHSQVDKKITLKEFEYGLENLLYAGYKPQEISVYVLLGLPTETIEDVYNSVNYISKYNLRIRLCELSIVPKTKLFSKLGLDENIDPLLYNNSIFLFNGILGKIPPWCSYNEFIKLKDYVRELNSKNKVTEYV